MAAKGLLTAAVCALTPQAWAQLTVTPITWDVLGLDSNKPLDGPKKFIVGARVRNGGAAPATEVSARFVWDTTNTSITLTGNSTVNLGTLAPGTSTDAYFNVEVDQNPAVYNMKRGYRIIASAKSLPDAVTPVPRELYVEKLVSQNRNAVTAFNGPTTVFLGQTYTYTVNSNTATNGYEQLEEFCNFPNNIFQIQSVSRTYTAPSALTTNTLYADGCGWRSSAVVSGSGSCGTGPLKYGGVLTTTYQVRIVGTGSATLTNLIYDYSGSSFHYNGDLGTGVNSKLVTVVSNGTVTGHLFSDPNGNGVQNIGEPNLPGVSVKLTLADSSTTTVVTNASGDYSASVLAGTVTAEVVAATLPAGSVCTTNNALQTVTVPAGGSVATTPVGYQRPGTLSGLVFGDTNGNGVRDNGELGLGGVKLVITSSLGGTQTVTTLADGTYSAAVPAGSTGINLDETTLLPGSVQTAGTDPQTVTVPAGANVVAQDLGYQRRGTLSGLVFADTNGNGTRDTGELGMGSIQLVITNSLGGTQTVTTLADGTYNATVPVGSTGIDLNDNTLPSGSVRTAGTDPQTVTVSGGANTAAQDLGYQRRGTISGLVFHDVNGNGLRDTGELGMGSIQLVITNSLGGTQTVTTLADGTYSATVPVGSTGIDLNDNTLPSGSVRTAGTDPQTVTVTGAANTVAQDLGYQRRGTLSGLVFADTNGNGTRDNGEPGMGNIQLVITNSLGVSKTVTTLVDGTYSTTVPVGSTGIDLNENTLPAGSVRTAGTDPQTVTVSGGANTAAQDLGYQQRGTLSGLVFADTNGNGTRDTGELGLGSIQLVITNSVGGTQTVTTLADGTYSATVPVGSTGIDLNENTLPAGSVRTAGTDPQTVTVSGATNTVAQDLGYQRRGTISGLVFADTNGNGTRDGGEPGLGGVKLVITDSLNKTQTVTTLNDGTYSASVPVGSTGINLDETTLAPGSMRTAGNDPQTVNVSGGANAAAQDLGYQRRGVVSGLVFADVNGNGLRDTGEAGLEGIKLVVTDATGTTQAVTTAGDGSYYASVAAGSTRIDLDEASLPSGSLHTAGTDPQTLTVVGGGDSVAEDLGYQRLGVLSGHVFNDSNGDGDQDGGEGPLASVTTIVTDSLGTTHTVVTDSNGNWTVMLPVGPASADVVDATLPTGSVRTAGLDPQSATVDADTPASVLFGYQFTSQQPGTLTGHVFIDTNGNGVQENGEPNLGGVKVVVTDSKGGVHNLTTDNAGNYQVSVTDGTATANVDDSTLPAGSVRTAGTDPQQVTVPGGSSAAADPVGYQLRATVNGHVFLDSDGNGTQEGGEPGLGDVRVIVTGPTGSPVTVVTNSTGDYSTTVTIPFTGPVSTGLVGTDVDEASLPAGYLRTAGTDPQSVTATAGSSVNVNPVGYQPPTPAVDSTYAVGFEDQLGPANNDWDYNDFMILVKSHETFAGSGLAKVQMRIESAARGATIVNQFFQNVRVKGPWSARVEIYQDRDAQVPLSTRETTGSGDARLLVWNSTLEALPPYPGTWSTNTAVTQTTTSLGQVARITINVLEPALNPAGVRHRAPFDPYLKQKNGEIHLTREGFPNSVEVVVNPASPLYGYNLDYAFAFPIDTYIWNRESRFIWNAYPRFGNFILSGKTADQDWWNPALRNKSETWNYYSYPTAEVIWPRLLQEAAAAKETPKLVTSGVNQIVKTDKPIVAPLGVASVNGSPRILWGTQTEAGSADAAASATLPLNSGRSRPLVTRLAADGPELLLTAEDRYDGQAAVEARLWPAGTLVWRKVIGSSVKAPMVATSLDGSANKTVLVVTDSARLCAIRPDGTDAFTSVSLGTPLVEAKNLLVGPAPVVADLDGDGTREIIATSCAGKVYVVSAGGTVKSGWPVSLNVAVSASPVIARSPVTGQARVLVGTRDGRIFCWNANGQAAAGFPKDLGMPILASPALYTDGNGRQISVWASYTGNVVQLDGDANVVASWNAPQDETVLASPVIGDVDGDGAQDIVIATETGKLCAWKTSGEQLTGFPFAVGSAIQATPLLADLDSNGRLEICFGTALGEVKSWSAPASAASTTRSVNTPAALWPQALGSAGGDTFLEQTYTAPGLSGIDHWSEY